MEQGINVILPGVVLYSAVLLNFIVHDLYFLHTCCDLFYVYVVGKNIFNMIIVKKFN